jgi:hypothetical protein
MMLLSKSKSALLPLFEGISLLLASTPKAAPSAQEFLVNLGHTLFIGFMAVSFS